MDDTGEPYLAAGFTIIDHSEYVSKKSQVVYRDTVKLFVCKQETLKMLQMLAAKRGGLAGCTFDVMRTGDMSANVGNMFDFVKKTNLEDLRKQFEVPPTNNDPGKIIAPIDYGSAIVYRTAEVLRALGFGAPPVGGGNTGDYTDVPF